VPKTGNNDKIFLLNEKYVCLEIMFLLNLSKSWKHILYAVRHLMSVIQYFCFLTIQTLRKGS